MTPPWLVEHLLTPRSHALERYTPATSAERESMFRVHYDDLVDVLASMTTVRPDPDGRHTWHPMSLSATLTGDKHRGAGCVLAEAAASEHHAFEWRTPDLLVIELDDATFHVPRDQVGEVLDVDLPEKPHARTVSIELMAELTLDVTVEYAEREAAKPRA